MKLYDYLLRMKQMCLDLASILLKAGELSLTEFYTNAGIGFSSKAFDLSLEQSTQEIGLKEIDSYLNLESVLASVKKEVKNG